MLELVRHRSRRQKDGELQERLFVD
jgi:hypothetical protein